ncbi:MAG: indolepyruvate oxidoreductase subunit beta [Dehalococcoidales bacterium]|nr:indolepyruvate oxidoreductase subunit beta [Dehalococcoidales bacterium]
MIIKALTKDPLNLIIAGVGGQGNVVMSQIIGNALLQKSYLVTIGETYGASQRGGSVMSHLRISREFQYSPIIPVERADIILGMEPVETLRMLLKYGTSNIVTIVNPRPIHSISVLSGDAEYPDLNELINTIKKLSMKTWVVNATEEAANMGNPVVSNTVLLGALIESNILPLDQKDIEPLILERFNKAYEINMRAFNRGKEIVSLGTA